MEAPFFSFFSRDRVRRWRPVRRGSSGGVAV
jgi:hypothetical protein